MAGSQYSSLPSWHGRPAHEPFTVMSIPPRVAFAWLLFVTVLLSSCERRVPRGVPTEPTPSPRPTPVATAMPPVVTRATPTVTPAKTPAPDTASTAAKRQAAMATEAARLSRRLGRKFHVRYQWPFVVAGNIPRANFDRIFNSSIMDSYRCLRSDYFPTEPDRLITVYLFKNDEDYRYYARELFDDDPDTPYGYFSPTEHALIMNIATGTGTLVHEMTHPLIDHDFPDCPTWFNEGLASLHEQCTWRSGSLVGLPNWRLPKLQEAIREGKPLALKELLSKIDAARFYGQDKGLNYATARYLCQYLQQQGKLKAFYPQLKRDFEKDPTGQKALEAILGSPLDKIELVWRKWVLTLRFRR